MQDSAKYKPQKTNVECPRCHNRDNLAVFLEDPARSPIYTKYAIGLELMAYCSPCLKSKSLDRSTFTYTVHLPVQKARRVQCAIDRVMPVHMNW